MTCRTTRPPDDDQIMTSQPFDPTRTYLHLCEGQAEQMTVNEDFWAGVASGARPLPGWSSDSQGMGSSGTSTTSDPAHVSVLTPCYTFGVLPAFTRN